MDLLGTLFTMNCLPVLFSMTGGGHDWPKLDVLVFTIGLRMVLRLPFLEEDWESSWEEMALSEPGLDPREMRLSPDSGMSSNPAENDILVSKGSGNTSSLPSQSFITGVTSLRLATLDTVSCTRSFSWSSGFSISSVFSLALSSFAKLSSMHVPESPVSHFSNLASLQTSSEVSPSCFIGSDEMRTGLEVLLTISIWASGSEVLSSGELP